LTTIKEDAIYIMPRAKTWKAPVEKAPVKKAPVKKAPSKSEGWQIVGKMRKQATIPHEISPVWCKYESDLWNLYFETLTGKNIGFELTPHSFPYFSPLECRRNLDRLLQTLFSKRPIVLDLTCGSGSDSIAFLMHLNPEQIFCVDFMSDEDFKVALTNMQKYVNAFPETYGQMTIMRNGEKVEGQSIWDQRISMHQQQASDFINRFATQFKKRKNWQTCEILGYFDPAWDARYLPGLSDEEYEEFLKEAGGVEYEVSPKILFDYIQKHILEPMLAKEIQFSVFCIKVRWEMTPAKMQAYLNLNPAVGQHFVVLYSVQALPFVKSYELDRDENGIQFITGRKRHDYGAVKGQFHWIIMKNTKYTYAQDVRSWWYKQWIEHSDAAVFVKKGSQVTPHKPLYESALPYPTVISRWDLAAKDKTKYIEIRPPRSIQAVQKEDIAYFTTELNKIKTEWLSSTSKTGLIDKVQNLVDGCKIYMDRDRWTTDDAVNLRKIVQIIKKLINEYGDAAANVKFTPPVDLGELLQQLQNLELALL
jgi:hypothetical protein